MSKQQNNLDSLFFFKSLPSAFFPFAREIDSGEQSQAR
jgi:hypothetical protein